MDRPHGSHRRPSRRTPRAGALLGVLALAWVSAAAAAPPGIEAFYGTYLGHTMSGAGEGYSMRDLNVAIRPHERGFTVEWTTVIWRPDGRRKAKSYSVNFRPSPRPGIFASAMRNDVFGNAVPLDPLKGDPYVWAALRDKTLIVYALLITDEGGYEIQVYERTLTPDGLRLRFSRVRDGRRLKLITATLKKVSD